MDYLVGVCRQKDIVLVGDEVLKAQIVVGPCFSVYGGVLVAKLIVNAGCKKKDFQSGMALSVLFLLSISIL
jgi:hypothetical protein